MSHLVFFDDRCGLCQNIVLWILQRDTHKQFLFAPLTGVTAKKVLHDHCDTSTLVLIESPHNRKWLRGKAACRILSLLGWKWVRWISYFPGVDLIYRLIAFCRGWFCKPLPSSVFEKFRDRFLE